MSSQFHALNLIDQVLDSFWGFENHQSIYSEISMVYIEVTSREVCQKFICGNVNLSISYFPKGTGTLIKCFSDEKTLENQDFLTIAFQDLKFIFAIQRQPIPNFDLRFDESDLSDFVENSLDILIKNLESTILKVKHFLMDLDNQGDALKILLFIDMNFIENVTLINRIKSDDKKVLKIDEIEKSELWRRAKNVDVIGFR
ncbi:Protein CBG22625 [Caenorhabditis briggsae]|uniref:Protein CBG22625 n=1 Tax=Caenorhabditis briggsae TaxID=6238 RepID=A8Y2Q2_CAEBR|nr:Protein CBG22625 [Caenorhabditis briggsae]CAP39177.2 Protein CBG22625 [Caenorhabditis briggsae]